MTSNDTAVPNHHGESPFYAYLIAAALAGIQVWWLFPWSFLSGHGLFFFDGDVAKDISGWLFFARDAWQLPLLFTPWLNYPQGISIAFTDSIPLMALLLKPFAGWFPAGFHYFGFWHAIAYGTQALAAVFLIRSLGIRTLFGAFAAAAFALMWPVLLYRFGHSALLAQGLLLFALGCYFHAYRGAWPATRAAILLIATCQVALLVHPYLMALCYAVFAAFLLDEGIRYRQWLVQLGRLIIAVAITLLLSALLGFFGSELSTGAYGQYALGLTALWCGGTSSQWFTCNPGGGESYAYLGAGALFLLAVSCLLAWRSMFGLGLARRHPGLVLVCILLALFAITHRVHIGPHVVYEFNLPTRVQTLFSLFQASARFIWPISYLLLFAALAATLRRGWLGVALVTVALALQWHDTDIRRDEIRVAARASERSIDPAWTTALRDIAHVSMFPAFGCGDIDRLAYLPVQYLAAVHGATFNTAYAARYTTDCAVKHAYFQRDVPRGSLYLAPAALPGQALPAVFRTAAQHGQCKTLTVAPVLWGVSRPQELLACRAEPVDAW